MVRRTAKSVGAFAALVMLASAVAACGTGSAGEGSVQLSLVAYSTPQAAYAKIIKAFRATPEGKNITFTQSYGASGDQSRAVGSGLKADIVAFSLEPDISRLVKAGLVAEDWRNDEAEGMVTKSVVVLATRKGNPKGVKTWDDVVDGKLEVITPNPFTSGSARWNVMAAYGAKSAKGTKKDDGVTYLNQLFNNVPVQDDTARKALQTFTGGKGDVMLAYENEAIFAQQKGQKLDYVVPDSTILIENPIAITKKSKHPKEAAAFLKFLRSEKAQKIFAENGYRPLTDGVPGADFPQPKELFTIDDLGGWTTVTKEFFDPQKSIMADIERKLGVSTEKK
jgi:sulfate transport system substrate-binding protein